MAPAVLSLARTATTATTSADYYGVHPKHGSLGDFVEFMNHAEALGIRVIVDLVVNHTSIDSRGSSRRAQTRHRATATGTSGPTSGPRITRTGIVFPGRQKTTWTRDRRAGEYYFHRFYEHQPDLNTWNPYVRAEIQKIMGFWLQLGVSGFRMDAVPFLIEKKGAGVEQRAGLQAAQGDARLPAVAAAARPSCWPRRTCRPTRA